MSSLFLGFDLSTQGLSCAIVDERLTVVYERAVNFDRDLPAFRTTGGVHRHADGRTVTSPPRMWMAALDLLLTRMVADNAPLAEVVAISGSGQQHGSVWLNGAARPALQNLDAKRTLSDQLDDIFALDESPVWMDSSTEAQCAALEAALGGPQAVAELTGSRAYARFTGNQIAKIAQEQPEVYAATAHLTLVSAFMASLLIGDEAPVDAGDASGMNLMDIRTRDWSLAALAATAPGLAGRLGAIVPSHTALGALHAYYAARYGFAPDCAVFAFSGDNPNSLAGLRLACTGDVAISLGTSDTVFGSLAAPRPSASEGHIFVNPVQPDAFMALICYQNGSLTREFVRDRAADGSWQVLNEMLLQTDPGNGGRIGFFIREPEITPTIAKTGIRRFGPDDAPAAFSPAEDVRAVYEGQLLSMRLHGGNVGLIPRRILATGGASVDDGLIRTMADVFGVPVMTAAITNTAALGAAYRALHGRRCRSAGRCVPFAEAIADAPPFRKLADPDREAHAVYMRMLPRYAALEAAIVNE
jgi:xylulokinase